MRAATICLLLLLGCGGCATPRQELARFEFSKPEMGVPFRIVLYAPSESKAKAAADAAFRRIEDLNAIMSDYEPESELNKLSASSTEGKAVRVSSDLWRVLSTADKLARETDGAFDVTVGPIVRLWRKARRDHKLPDPAKLTEAMQPVGFKKMILDPATRSVRLTVPGMKLDLGAIAKGYAVDEALKILAREGIRAALVGGAGDMAASGAPPDKPGWRIEIGAFDLAPPESVRSVNLRNSAIATSGDVFQKLEFEGVRYSHIVDPKTGIGLTDHGLVTVLGRNCMQADSLATSVSVLGPRKGIALIERTPGTAAQVTRVVEGKIEHFASKGFQERLLAPR